eukprot:gnl/MRDRNA2_/MRDRNA2_324219_c0_seq1.p1 gnl/MRDRNA2_/MRDRNA2_324219_c0~~gnl/MRDRNA2_/MRDRNA2_324219_c0_seq1.p1  ORF type:complete len:147 (+),score=23.83 gnl/MRDRNA2_/MRDRNA2_324219_c0_seq1:30-443(+)
MVPSEYMRSWGKTLISIRMSDALEKPNIAEEVRVFDYELSTLARQQTAGLKLHGDDDLVGVTLAKLQDYGLVKQHTTCDAWERAHGYQGFWEASLPLLRLLDSATVVLSQDATVESVFAAYSLLQSIPKVSCSTTWR